MYSPAQCIWFGWFSSSWFNYDFDITAVRMKRPPCFWCLILTSFIVHIYTTIYTSISASGARYSRIGCVFYLWQVQLRAGLPSSQRIVWLVWIRQKSCEVYNYYGPSDHKSTSLRSFICIMNGLIALSGCLKYIALIRLFEIINIWAVDCGAL